MKRLRNFKLFLVELRQKWNKAKLPKATVFWIALGAVILTVYVGFSRAGWVTNATASRMSETTSTDAVVERLAPICLAQVNQDPLKGQKLEELRALPYTSSRTTFVKNQGWANMPGETKPDNDVAAECARRLMLLDQ